VAGAVLVSSGPAANAVTYSTSGALTATNDFTLYQLGDTIGSSFDQLKVAGVTGTVDQNAPIVLNNLTFTAGVNATVPAANQNFSFTENVTIDGVTATVTVPFKLSIDYADTLNVLGGTTFSMLVGANYWNIVLSALTMGPNGGGALTANLMAQISDPPAATPLPAALLLFGSGLGAMGLFGRRRKLKASAVAGA
jgi:hypothetical protein